MKPWILAVEIFIVVISLGLIPVIIINIKKRFKPSIGISIFSLIISVLLSAFFGYAFLTLTGIIYAIFFQQGGLAH